MIKTLFRPFNSSVIILTDTIMIKTLFRPFNNEIPSDFWGNSKTHTYTFVKTQLDSDGKEINNNYSYNLVYIHYTFVCCLYLYIGT
jgi:hypothetical protein